MRRRVVSTVVAATVMTVLAVLGGTNAAQAADPSKNVGWLYTGGGGGAVFFDADLAGYPGYEKVTVCDNKSNSMGVEAYVDIPFGGYGTFYVKDPSNDGHCASIQGNFFPDGYSVLVAVYEYAGDTITNGNTAYGVS